MPKHNPLDDPGRHALYLDRACIKFLRDLKAGAPMNTDPAYPRMIMAGFYDGLGTLLPLGAYWWERVHSQSMNFWLLASCFDFFDSGYLDNPDEQLRTYMHCLQLDRYPDSLKAFNDYRKLRRNPDYEVKFSLPNYMIDGDGVIIDLEANPFAPRMGGWWEEGDQVVSLADVDDDEPEEDESVFDIL